MATGRLYLSRLERRLASGAGITLVLVALLMVFAPPGERKRSLAAPLRMRHAARSLSTETPTYSPACSRHSAARRCSLASLASASRRSRRRWRRTCKRELRRGDEGTCASACGRQHASVRRTSDSRSQPRRRGVRAAPTGRTHGVDPYRPRRVSGKDRPVHHRVFLTDLLGAPTQARQRYRNWFAVFLVGHDHVVDDGVVESAVMYFGRHWGSQFLRGDLELRPQAGRGD